MDTDLNAMIVGQDAKIEANVSECRLWLIGDLLSDGRAGTYRRHGGAVAPIGTRESIAANLSNCPAAVHGTIVRRCLNMLNARKIQAGALVELRVCCSRSG